jgi:hypothetical protein
VPLRSESRYQSAQVAALGMSCAVDPIIRGPIEHALPVDRTPDGNFAGVLIDGPKPNRLPVTEIRSPLDEKPGDDAEPPTGVLDERKTGTPVGGQEGAPLLFVAFWRASGDAVWSKADRGIFSLRADDTVAIRSSSAWIAAGAGGCSGGEDGDKTCYEVLG